MPMTRRPGTTATHTEMALIERKVGAGLDFLFKAGRLLLDVALEPDGADPVFRGDLDNEIKGAGVDLLLLDLDILEQAGAVERPVVAVDHRVVEAAPLTHLHVGADDLLVDVGGPDELDRDGADLENRGGGLRRLGRGQRLRPDRTATRHQPKNRKK